MNKSIEGEEKPESNVTGNGFEAITYNVEE